jgi:carboxypeptidase Taq
LESKLNELKQRLATINDLQSAGAVLSWDQATYMPPGGGTARGRQLATLGRLAHEHLTDPAVGELFEALQPYGAGLPYDSDDAALLRVSRYDYEQATKVPAELMGRLLSHQAAAYAAWARARPENDFAAVQPYLQTTLELSRALAQCFPGQAHIADPLIDLADYGMRVATMRALFADLRKQLVPLVQAISAQPPADDACLKQAYPEEQQLAFGVEVIKRLGYDFSRGRQDKTHHPFMTRFGLGDVRITTRAKEHDLSDALFSTIHEAGHAMYEQGIRMDLDGLPLASGTSAGVHESQSRLWENLVGRSRPFWQHFYPQLQAVFPQQLGAVPLDTFYRAINNVQRSLIRADADEVTYNLHVIIRFDLELALLEGQLAVRDLPEAWRERYRSDLGITPPDDRDGVLQDVHWYAGIIGGQFQGYTLGNVLSAQFFDAAVAAHPDIPQAIGRGEFGALHTWLQTQIYQHGRKFTANELVERATGRPLTTAPYMAYLQRKYGALYRLT